MYEYLQTLSPLALNQTNIYPNISVHIHKYRCLTVVAHPSVDHLHTSCVASLVSMFVRSANTLVVNKALFYRSAAHYKVQAISDSGCAYAHKINPLTSFLLSFFTLSSTIFYCFPHNFRLLLSLHREIFSYSYLNIIRLQHFNCGVHEDDCRLGCFVLWSGRN
jgi:hypothetical protein